MNVAGIVVEYNPFHNGHAYHIEASKRTTNANIVVAVMSGHFLQRGEPAIFDKWTRCTQALLNGVDVVFELPVIFATQNAQSFAYGAISLLDQLNCVDSICFGSELGDIDLLTHLSNILKDEPPKFKDSLKKHLNSGMTYPSAVTLALGDIMELSIGNTLTKPNNMLGLMYLLALHKLNSKITPFTIQRMSADYHQTSITDQSIASATAIRKLYLSKNVTDIRSYIPDNCYELTANSYVNGIILEDFRDILFAKIHSLGLIDLEQFLDVEEGLEYRIKRAINKSVTVNDLITHTKSKRYTQTRIQRILIHILLDMKKTNLLPIKSAQYAKVLGFTQNGRRFLQKVKKSSSIPIIDMFGKDQPLYSSYDITATKIYSLVEEKKRTGNITLPDLTTRDFKQPPIQL